MNKIIIFCISLSVSVILSGCVISQEETKDYISEDNNLENVVAEQQDRIAELERVQTETHQSEEASNKRRILEQCEETKKICSVKISAIGTEDVELYNDHGTYWGLVKGDRNKAIKEIEEETKKSEKYIKEKEEEIEDSSKDGNVYRAIKNSIERKEDDIDRNEKKIKKIEELIQKEESDRILLLNGDCKDYEISC